ncbi:MAG: 3-deoxy-D-manno-octulosonic acid transferase [Candidatus Brocadia sp. AMX2]|uniref:3-deoxy-D-manno-octulosonic acid transferase n=1 Tax=Candidatus Brocadia sp. AMX2 TaxID=2293635 RepID=UPI000EBC0D6B|nr:3-deoxy-D-manno-octulosonic acid transferase [Candidatus Brocadia sp. AMX2]MBC6932137.1 3-deoxy-D-manno-octulosonic acid transferase [Candidatus Brocadia sp.]MBL1169406.1 3-deoxy-D-manno-octulosonic acid transferase [Candidatus Brocadia sp. AMX1]MCK6469084.1 3-deoxy-D-manno-octulosonic acid transferase [Candidatus Brocadia sinica]NOG42282.1 3-deoxy-D-manno-octulosonic acid transferase [Planctomycetota bacterium]KAA0244986.1 MAG: 3-deoxy-D-manno-octulosonic acid transferase [Candidatus Broca
MSTIFDAVYITALTFGSPYFFLKFITSKRYRSGLPQRLGWIETRERKKPCVWIHCASVGEVLTAKALVKSIEKEFNYLDIVVTTNTNTGLSVAKQCFHDKKTFYFPLDLSWVTEKVLSTIQPICVILIELEIWPNFLIATAKRHIPVVLLNARISEKSFKWYRMVRKLSKGFFESLATRDNAFCARTEADATRLMNLGISEIQILITGNMKFDNMVTDVPEDTKKRLMCLLEIDKDDKVVVCGSTHGGEERVILKIFKHLCTKIKKLRLILVPRHIERADTIGKLIESMGLRWIKKTALDKGNKIGESRYETVILVDTVGELLATYSIADCVFVGKSLVPLGGQNMMEPAGLAKPVIVGPHTFNFLEAVQLLREADAIKVVQDEPSLLKEMMYLLEHPDEAQEIGKRAQSVVIKQRGATDRNLKVLRKILLKERTVSV